jgi:hypothetical protein
VDARGAALRQQQHKEKAGRATSDAVQVWLGRLISVGVVTLGILLIDGGRRGGENFVMRVSSVQAPVAFARVVHGMSQEIPQNLKAEVGTALQEEDTATTSDGGTTILSFPEGSAVRLEPSSAMTVKLLDYERNGRCDRTLGLSSGGMTVRVGQYFSSGMMRVLAGSAVVASAGGTFRVAVAGNSTTIVEVFGGKCRVRTGTDARELSQGQRVTISEKGIETAGSPNRTPEQSAVIEKLKLLDVAPSGLTKAETAVWSVPDALFRRFGVTAGGVNLLAADAARKAECVLALEKCKTLISGRGEPPAHLSPEMGELGGTNNEVQKLLPNFVGGIIDEYKRNEKSYVLRVRARDVAQTTYELTPSGVRELK